MKEQDIRYQRTNQRILEAMTHLLQKKNFDNITIKDICEEAKISRSGFYLHYVDKYQFIELYMAEFMTKINTLFDKNNSGIDQQLMLTILYYLKEEGQLFSLLLSDKGSQEIQTSLKKILQKNARLNILPKLKQNIASPTEERYIVVFLSNALFGLLQEWIHTGQKESPEELIHIIEQLIAFDYFNK